MHLSAFSEHGLLAFLGEIDCWLPILDTWGEGHASVSNFPLLSPAAPTADPAAIHTVVSDASGPDAVDAQSV
jgi:hypothetical protein